jgi:hypothetical protein
MPLKLVPNTAEASPVSMAEILDFVQQAGWFN